MTNASFPILLNMATTSMSRNDFKSYCDHFIGISNDLQDGWQTVDTTSDYQSGVYLKKQVVKSFVLSTKDGKLVEKSSSDEVDLDFDDPSSQNTAGFPETVTWEYHIVYSESYRVPVLYFNSWKNDGSILTFEEILAWCHSELKPQLLENRWQSITQQEHPILGVPFYTLHPCKTAEYLNTIQRNSGMNPLVSWLSSFGGAVGLSLPLEYGMIPNEP